MDEYAAGVVRRIFDLTVNGNGPYEIARTLHDSKIEKPSYYLARTGYVKKASALDVADPYVWSAFTVSKIIESVSYLGHLVNFRYEKPSFKSKKFIERPKDDWLIFENHHDAIVPAETWELAQTLRQTKRRTDTIEEANPLTGLVFCHDCGSKMYNHRGKGQKSNYVCGDYKTGKSNFADNHCSQHYVKGFVPLELQNNFQNVITREEFCRMAVKWVEYATGKSIDTILSERGLSRNPNAFTDTSDSDILAAFALGITSGVGNNLFNPSGQFSREQAATMIMNTCRAIGANVDNPPASGFADMGSAASWAVNGINFVRANGIMQGTGNNNFTPQGTYTIEQSIVTFNNINHNALPGR